ncbi:hypothetical protein P5P86_08590 [Nocardioides sp. BP30]|uniref:hypothetical protein n=1 Tax=Nocardioides sp. BP30 TaxID=3036374 RepID=UPI0024697736|nr:hypothetical protein [Nocardioides sp. BP30]WGL53873.1 hypothetical protein P5P86_08590 [Nocardioides sp. BP30]
MSDQLTTGTGGAAEPVRPAERGPAARSAVLRVALIQAGAIVVAFAVIGVICGFIWAAAWSPAQGAVVKHVWYPLSWDRAQPTYFAGTGWYVVIGMIAGAIVGALAAWLCDRAELVTLAAVVLGGLLAAYLMRVVGLHRGPGDPQRLAKTAADGTKLPSQLTLTNWWMLAAMPGGALASLSVVFLTVTKRTPVRHPQDGSEPAPAGPPTA